jgi:short-subunit dehydrogenase
LAENSKAAIHLRNLGFLTLNRCPKSVSFKNKVIWITGASSGLGEAMARAFYTEGARLILSSRREEVLNELKEELGGVDVHVLPLDLTDTDSHPELAAKAHALYGRIDILVNNGGVSQRSSAFDTTLDTVRKMMEINFFGTVSLTKALLPYLIEQDEAHIVVTSSVMGKYTIKTRSTYSASKFALHGYFDSLRLEQHENNIHVTLVCPGFVNTNITRNAMLGDGSAFNKGGEFHEKAMTADEFAQKLLPAIEKKKREVHIAGFKESFGLFMKRFFPGLLHRILLKSDVG